MTERPAARARTYPPVQPTVVACALLLVITSLSLIESVRSSNRVFDVVEGTIDNERDMSAYTVQVGRHKIGELIRDKAGPQLEDLGIRLVDVRLRRINYVEEVRRKVYDRMISERKRIAERFRSEGQGMVSEVEGKKDRELKNILSSAYREAEEIRGEADAEQESDTSGQVSDGREDS